MSESAERIYTINLGKVLLSPNNVRARRAINMIRDFARHHMKNEDILIEEDVAHYVWKRGIKHPPRKIRVGMDMNDEGKIRVYLYDATEARGEIIDDTEPEPDESASVAAIGAQEEQSDLEEQPELEQQPAPAEQPTPEPAPKEQPELEQQPAPAEQPVPEEPEPKETSEPEGSPSETKPTSEKAKADTD